MIRYLVYRYTKLIQKLYSDGLMLTWYIAARQKINDLSEDSEDLFHASWIDTYYPNRPANLEDTNLCDFLEWHDIGSDEPKQSGIYFLF